MTWQDEIRKKFPEGIKPRKDNVQETEEEELERLRIGHGINRPERLADEAAYNAELAAREAPTTVVYVVDDGAVDKVFKNKSDAEAYAKEKGVDYNVTEYKLE